MIFTIGPCGPFKSIHSTGIKHNPNGGVTIGIETDDDRWKGWLELSPYEVRLINHRVIRRING